MSLHGCWPVQHKYRLPGSGHAGRLQASISCQTACANVHAGTRKVVPRAECHAPALDLVVCPPISTQARAAKSFVSADSEPGSAVTPHAVTLQHVSTGSAAATNCSSSASDSSSASTSTSTSSSSSSICTNKVVTCHATQDIHASTSSRSSAGTVDYNKKASGGFNGYTLHLTGDTLHISQSTSRSVGQTAAVSCTAVIDICSTGTTNSKLAWPAIVGSTNGWSSSSMSPVTCSWNGSGIAAGQVFDDLYLGQHVQAVASSCRSGTSSGVVTGRSSYKHSATGAWPLSYRKQNVPNKNVPKQNVPLKYVITQQIKACKSAQQVAIIVQEYGLAFNAIHISAALTHLAQRSSQAADTHMQLPPWQQQLQLVPGQQDGHMQHQQQQQQQHAALVGQLVSMAVAQLHEFGARQLANSLWALAKLGYSQHIAALSAMFDQAAVVFDQCNSQELSNILYAAAKLSWQPSDSWMAAYLQTWTNMLDPSSSSSSISRGSSSGSTAMELQERDTLQKQQLLSSSTNRTAVAQQHSKQHTTLSAQSQQQSAHCTSQCIANVVWALAVLHQSPGDAWLQMVVRYSLPQLGEWSARSIPVLFWGLSVLGVRERPLGAPQQQQEQQQQRHRSQQQRPQQRPQQPQQQQQLVHSTLVDELQPGVKQLTAPALSTHLWRAVERHVSSYSPQDVSNILTAVARMQLQPPQPLLRQLLWHASCKLQAVVNAATAGSSCGGSCGASSSNCDVTPVQQLSSRHDSSSSLHHSSSNGTSEAGSSSSAESDTDSGRSENQRKSEQSNIVTASSSSSSRDEGFMHASVCHTVSSILWAVAQLDVRLPPSLLQPYLQVFLSSRAQSTGQAVANVAWALVQLDLVKHCSDAVPDLLAAAADVAEAQADMAVRRADVAHHGAHSRSDLPASRSDVSHGLTAQAVANILWACARATSPCNSSVNHDMGNTSDTKRQRQAAGSSKRNRRASSHRNRSGGTDSSLSSSRSTNALPGSVNTTTTSSSSSSSSNAIAGSSSNHDQRQFDCNVDRLVKASVHLLQSATLHDISQIMWSLVTLKHQPCDTVMSAINQQLQQLLSQLSCQEQSMVACCEQRLTSTGHQLPTAVQQAVLLGNAGVDACACGCSSGGMLQPWLPTVNGNSHAASLRDLSRQTTSDHTWFSQSGSVMMSHGFCSPNCNVSAFSSAPASASALPLAATASATAYSAHPDTALSSRDTPQETAAAYVQQQHTPQASPAAAQAQSVAQLTWAMSKLQPGCVPAELLQLLVHASLPLLQHMSAQGLSNMLYGMVTLIAHAQLLHIQHQQLQKQQQQHKQHKQHKHKQQQQQQKQLVLKHSQTQHRLLNGCHVHQPHQSASEVLPQQQYNIRSASDSAVTPAITDAPPPKPAAPAAPADGCGLLTTAWLEAYCQAAVLHLPHMAPQALSNMLWALGRLRYHPGSSFMAAAMQEVARQLPSWSARDMANALWAVARLQHWPGQQWLKAFMVQWESKLAYSNKADSTQVNWALQQLARFSRL
eukprot:jgi/Chrzof1/9288/UNPLg00255.t1